MGFLVIDFETACSDNSSICQIGLVKYANEECQILIDDLVNPQTEFTNSAIHGITEDDIIDSPSFEEYYPKMKEIMQDKIVFNHNGADKSKFESACEKYGLPIFNVIWLNSATLVRRTWKQFSKSGYGVEDMCDFLGIGFNPHNAASDSCATARIIKTACDIKGFTIEDWKQELSKSSSSGRKRNYQPYDDSQKIRGELTDAPDLSAVVIKENPFFGKKVVISGTYDNWPDRKELAILLKELGADIDSSIGKYTNFLCAGLGVGPKKIEKMEQKIQKGEEAQILVEDEIIELLRNIR